MVLIVVVFALYLFKKVQFEILSVMLICIAMIKMGASMLKASYYRQQCEEMEQERDILREKAVCLEEELQKLTK